MATVREEIATLVDPPPDDLVAHFEAGGHPSDPDLGIRLLSLGEALEYSRDLHEMTLLGHSMGLFTLLDADDSNPFCYVSRGPARGSVLHFYHDGDPAIEFASLAEFRDALDAAVRGDVFIDDLPPGTPPRIDQRELHDHLLRLAEDDSEEAEFELPILIRHVDPENARLLRQMAAHPDLHVREAVATLVQSRPSPALAEVAEILANDPVSQVARPARLARTAIAAMR